MDNPTSDDPTPQELAENVSFRQLVRLAENATEATQVFRRLVYMLGMIDYAFVETDWRDTPYVIFKRGTSMKDGQRFFTLADAMEAAIDIIAAHRAQGSE